MFVVVSFFWFLCRRLPGSSHSCGCIVLFHSSLYLVNYWCDVSGRYFRIFPSLVSPFVYGVYAPNRNPGSPMEAFEHLLFFCPLAQSVLSWLQSLMFSFSFMCPSLLSHHVLFGFNSDKLVATPISLCIC